MRLAWSGPAVKDRKAIFSHIATENPIAAVAMDDLFVDRARLLLDHPKPGRPGRQPGTRELVAHRNYLLIYGINRGTILILRVLHGARQWPPTEEGS